jgi:hypothetical protein
VEAETGVLTSDKTGAQAQSKHNKVGV